MLSYLRHILALSGIIYLVGTSNAYAQQGNEYQVKAAFLYNLARMVEWPDDKSTSTDIPFTFCFYGKDFFGQALDSIKNKTIKNRSIFLKRNVSIRELGQCELLFISRTESSHLSNILPYIENLPVLTVGDTDRFAEQGGIVNLATQAGRIQIEVNLRSAKNAGLKISSRLLTLANIVEDAS
jgi:hypothetical protein